ncbi:MAG: hypothetical protein AVDCRST_MAG85-4161, partial [uncultured Solirubrobacteraceae bacterium]
EGPRRGSDRRDRPPAGPAARRGRSRGRRPHAKRGEGRRHRGHRRPRGRVRRLRPQGGAGGRGRRAAARRDGPDDRPSADLRRAADGPLLPRDGGPAHARHAERLRGGPATGRAAVLPERRVPLRAERERGAQERGRPAVPRGRAVPVGHRAAADRRARGARARPRRRRPALRDLLRPGDPLGRRQPARQGPPPTQAAGRRARRRDGVVHPRRGRGRRDGPRARLGGQRDPQRRRRPPDAGARVHARDRAGPRREAPAARSDVPRTAGLRAAAGPHGHHDARRLEREGAPGARLAAALPERRRRAARAM